MIKDYGFFHDYPYTNFHEMNLDWLLAQMIELRSDMKNFVNQNTIKYADPILWDITSQYESNTVVVDAGGNAYLSTQPVPAGVNINNMDYWTSIGNFSLLFASVKESIAAADEGTSTYASKNRAVGDLVWLNNILYEVTAPISTGQSYVIGTNVTEVTIEEKLGDIKDIIKDLPTLPVFNVADYGMIPDTNIYDQLFDFLREIIYPRGGGIVFFPKGTYTIDYTIIIPSNTMFIGEGNDSKILFDLTDNYIGCAIANGGSNILIRDMSVDIATNIPYPIGGSIPNAIGIGDFDYVRMDTKRSHDIYRQSGNHNISIINVDCPSSNYGIQIEPETNKVSDIYISNHHIPTGMCSITPLSDNTLIENVYMNDIVCDTLRFGNGYKGALNVNVDGLVCTQMLIKTCNVNITNFQINSAEGNRRSDSSQHTDLMVFAGNNIRLSNGSIQKLSSSPHTRLIHAITEVPPVKIFMDNIYLDPAASFSDSNIVSHASIFYDNVNFEPYPSASLKSYTGNVSSSSAPFKMQLNAMARKSYLCCCAVFTEGSTDTVIGYIPDAYIDTDIIKSGVGYGFLFNAGDRTKGVEPVSVRLNSSDKGIHVVRFGSQTAGYNCVYIELTW